MEIGRGEEAKHRAREPTLTSEAANWKENPEGKDDQRE